jgi:hypothetical protein
MLVESVQVLHETRNQRQAPPTPSSQRHGRILGQRHAQRAANTLKNTASIAGRPPPKVESNSTASRR